MFTSHALLSGIALYVSAASAATWQINVSNATAGLVFNPNNIVRQPNQPFSLNRRTDSLPLSDCRRGRHSRVYIQPQEPLRDPVQLCPTVHASFWRIRYWLVSLKFFFIIACHGQFIDGSPVASLLQTEPTIAASPRGNSL
jgi:hypothetical protein